MTQSYRQFLVNELIMLGATAILFQSWLTFIINVIAGNLAILVFIHWKPGFIISAIFAIMLVYLVGTINEHQPPPYWRLGILIPYAIFCIFIAPYIHQRWTSKKTGQPNQA